MTFKEVIDLIQHQKIRRKSWGDEKYHLFIDDFSEKIFCCDGKVQSQYAFDLEDLNATDWEVVV